MWKKLPNTDNSPHHALGGKGLCSTVAQAQSTDNTISDAEPQAGKNNVYTASANSRVVVGGALTAGSQIGVSVGNPYTKKDVVFSTSETKTMPGNLASRKGLIDQTAYTSYAFTAEDEGCFKYDGEGWTIFKDTEKPGPRLWLMRSSTPPGDLGTVVFDWNIPGESAKLEYQKAAGSKVSVPVVSDSALGKYTLRFTGWYDQPTGGNKVTGSVVEVPGGKYQVYYAQWEPVVNPGVPDPVGEGDMYIGYFDYNLDGAGVTSAYCAAGQFQWTVTVDGESKTYTARLQFQFPKDPYREGYTFGGWFQDKNCSVPLAAGTKVKDNQTFYAKWTAEKVKVSYYDTRQGTALVETQTYDYGDGFSVLDPLKDTDGWTFVRWETSDGQDAATIDTLDSAVLTYHAGGNGADTGIG